MKNIEMLLKELGIELTEEQKAGLTKGVEENYKTIADYNKQKEKLEAAEDKIKTTEEALKAFDGVDVAASKKQIADLQEDLKKKDDEYAAQLADRDFNDLLKDSISSPEIKGRNAKAITALLDIDTLKASNNQKADLDAALKALSEAEDSKMLFGDSEPNPVGTGNLIGTVTKTSGNTEDAAMRSAMGLPPVAESK